MPEDFIIDLPPPPSPRTHDERGKFLPGHTIRSPGNPHGVLQKRNRMALLNAITPEVARELTLNALGIALDSKARNADRLKATELLLRYSCGEPTQKHEVEVTATAPTPGPIDLDSTDVAALERIRAKLAAPAEIVVDASRNEATGTATE